MNKANDIGLFEYMANATDGFKFDFKRDGNKNNNDREFHHRGSLFYTDNDGEKVYASARDAGNFSAGYMAASKGINWNDARMAFDLLEFGKSIFKGNWVLGEGRQSTHAQALGYARKLGVRVGP